MHCSTDSLLCSRSLDSSHVPPSPRMSAGKISHIHLWTIYQSEVVYRNCGKMALDCIGNFAWQDYSVDVDFHSFSASDQFVLLK